VFASMYQANRSALGGDRPFLCNAFLMNEILFVFYLIKKPIHQEPMATQWFFLQ
jgi:hypothetical protein